MVIFMPASFDSHLRLDPAKHLVIHFTVDDLERYFPYYERLTKVRTSDVWNRQAKETGWLSDAPQVRWSPTHPDSVLLPPFASLPISCVFCASFRRVCRTTTRW